MNTRSKVLTSLASIGIAGSMLISGTALAQTTPAPAATTGTPSSWGKGGSHMMGARKPGVFGTVSAINGTTLTVTSKMMMGPKGSTAASATATTYTVNASSATVTKAGAASSLSAIAVGDTVMVAGTVSGTSVTATTIRDGVVPGMGMPGGMRGGMKGATSTPPIITGNGQPVIGGAVTAVSGNTLTVTNKSNVTYTVDVTNAKVQKGNALSTVAAIAVGDNVIVQGTVQGNAVTASSVMDQGAAPTAGSTGTPSAPHGFMGAIGGFFQKLFGFF